MLNEIKMPTESPSSFKTSYVTRTNPGSNNKRYCGYCLIKTSLSLSFGRCFNVSKVHNDNYSKI
jgi:hypothetical protein